MVSSRGRVDWWREAIVGDLGGHGVAALVRRARSTKDEAQRGQQRGGLHDGRVDGEAEEEQAGDAAGNETSQSDWRRRGRCLGAELIFRVWLRVWLTEANAMVTLQSASVIFIVGAERHRDDDPLELRAQDEFSRLAAVPKDARYVKKRKKRNNDKV